MKHKMFEEIEEQSKIIKQIMQREHDPEVTSIIALIRNTLDHGGEVYFVGSGSSYHSAVFATHLFAKNNSIIAVAIPAGDFDIYTADFKSNDLIIFISQSGENLTILESIHHIKNREINTALITNDTASSISHQVKKTLSLDISNEIAVPATKTYFAELLILSILSEGLKDGSALYKYQDAIHNEIEKICGQDNLTKMDNIVQTIIASENIYLLAEGAEYATAMEGALKFKECAQVFAEPYLLDEFLHGPCAMLKQDTPVFLINHQVLTSDQKVQKLIGLGAKIINIKTDNYGIFTPIISIVPLQILSYKTAIMKGLNPDKPRGLSKVVEY